MDRTSEQLRFAGQFDEKNTYGDRSSLYSPGEKAPPPPGEGRLFTRRRDSQLDPLPSLSGMLSFLHWDDFLRKISHQCLNLASEGHWTLTVLNAM